MSSVEWFYARDNKQLGPVAPAELKQLAERGELGPDDLVWRSGMSDWTPARRVKGLFGGETEAPAMVAEDDTMAVQPASRRTAGKAVRGVFEWTAAYRRSRGEDSRHLFDHLLDFARSHFTAQFVETTAKIFAGFGYYGLYATMAVVLVYGVAASIRGDDWGQLLMALVGIPALIVLQYVAGRFLEALARLNRVTPGRITSPAILDCFALLSFFLGAIALLGLTLLAVQTRAFALVIPALAAFILCQYMASIAINPEALYVTVAATAGAGEEALALFSFFLKLALQTVPVLFGVGIAGGTIEFGYAAVRTIIPPETVALEAAATARQAALTVFVSVVLPPAAYVVFLVGHLSIDILRGVVSLSNLAGTQAATEESERF